MVTFAQAQERAEEWINGDVPSCPACVRCGCVDLGFVVWAEDRADRVRHMEWQIFHELRAMNVPPDQVLELQPSWSRVSCRVRTARG
ncbi:hypothetical protein SVIOM74S_04534 [Streptomyces violarus]